MTWPALRRHRSTSNQGGAQGARLPQYQEDRMESGERDLTWQERVIVAMRRQGMSTRKVVAAAKSRGLRISAGQMAEAMKGNLKGGPDDRVVAAYSIVLGIHPDRLGFTRCPRTELGYLAFEAVHPGRAPREGGRLAAA